MTFKEELQELLKRYPEVKEVHIKPRVTHDIEIVDSVTSQTSVPVPPVAQNEAKQPNVFEKATMSAEDTIEYLKNRAGITTIQE